MEGLGIREGRIPGVEDRTQRGVVVTRRNLRSARRVVQLGVPLAAQLVEL